MKLELKRTKKSTTCTIGELYIDGRLFCYTLEDRDRGLNSAMSAETIKKIKVPRETAIPTGTYAIDMNTVSPKYKSRGAGSTYASIGFKVPRLVNVPGYVGVLIHIGNYPRDTEGCLLVAKSVASSGEAINNSKVAFFELYDKLKAAHARHEKITITIGY